VLPNPPPPDGKVGPPGTRGISRAVVVLTICFLAVGVMIVLAAVGGVIWATDHSPGPHYTVVTVTNDGSTPVTVQPCGRYTCAGSVPVALAPGGSYTWHPTGGDRTISSFVVEDSVGRVEGCLGQTDSVKPSNEVTLRTTERQDCVT